MKRTSLILLALLLCTPISARALAQNDDAATLVAGNTAFALDLYAAVRQDAAGNLLVSPYSVSQALAMTYAGAGGETAAQMAATLAFGLEPAALHAAFAALNADLIARANAEADPDEGETARALRIANALWGEQTYPFNQEYSALIAQSYGAGLQAVDFIGAPEEARAQINDWVAEQTEERIQNIVPPGAITPVTRLVLANAIWFYGGWADPFNPEATRDGDFFPRDGAAVTVPFMVQEAELPYVRGDGFQAIELPYAGSELAFTIILPDEGEFDAFEAGLDSAAFAAAVDQLASTNVLIHLPKFEFDFGASLAQSLQAMGMPDAFDPARADFTGMVEGAPPETLSIGDVLHKAFISLDENGTEAAAATVVIMVGTSAQEPIEPIELRIDRPFFFAIRDTRTGTLLFVGRVMNPSG